jgi:hypothetical protein
MVRFSRQDLVWNQLMKSNWRVATFFACVSSLNCIALCAGPPNWNAIDPETRQAIERRLDANPRMTAEAKDLLLKLWDEAAKIRITVDGITAYRNGVVFRYTVMSKLDADYRLPFVDRSFHEGNFTDGKGHEWGLRPWDGILDFHVTEAETVLIKRNSRVRLVQVDSYDGSTLIRLKPRGDHPTERPSKLSYHWFVRTTFDSPDMKRTEKGAILGRGTVPVDWKDMPIPTDLKSHVIDSTPLLKE